MPINDINDGTLSSRPDKLSGTRRAIKISHLVTSNNNNKNNHFIEWIIIEFTFKLYLHYLLYIYIYWKYIVECSLSLLVL